ncbi:hypothetical protein DUNSADRAFT_9191 [Dunaliella salina]|uniref:Encoded protein n=1 Tax=Dunaliella salina TaxID=3046 RepID=A0ABQ7GI07_DUNSA|nr:hypothetical protein DUNSADRAFT_9191 [Dunaliella salina]|eukprot:KAF5834238.1 hypothetical protein DUNSADRAFT_9191 [Dunaliella salina]
MPASIQLHCTNSAYNPSLLFDCVKQLWDCWFCLPQASTQCLPWMRPSAAAATRFCSWGASEKLRRCVLEGRYQHYNGTTRCTSLVLGVCVLGILLIFCSVKASNDSSYVHLCVVY